MLGPGGLRKRCSWRNDRRGRGRIVRADWPANSSIAQIAPAGSGTISAGGRASAAAAFRHRQIHRFERLASPCGNRLRSSSIVPSKISRPWLMMPTRWEISSAAASVCVDISTHMPGFAFGAEQILHQSNAVRIEADQRLVEHQQRAAN